MYRTPLPRVRCTDGHNHEVATAVVERETMSLGASATIAAGESDDSVRRRLAELEIGRLRSDVRSQNLTIENLTQVIKSLRGNGGGAVDPSTSAVMIRERVLSNLLAFVEAFPWQLVLQVLAVLGRSADARLPERLSEVPEVDFINLLVASLMVEIGVETDETSDTEDDRERRRELVLYLSLHRARFVRRLEGGGISDASLVALNEIATDMLARKLLDGSQDALAMARAVRSITAAHYGRRHPGAPAVPASPIIITTHQPASEVAEFALVRQLNEFTRRASEAESRVDRLETENERLRTLLRKRSERCEKPAVIATSPIKDEPTTGLALRCTHLATVLARPISPAPGAQLSMFSDGTLGLLDVRDEPVAPTDPEEIYGHTFPPAVRLDLGHSGGWLVFIHMQLYQRAPVSEITTADLNANIRRMASMYVATPGDAGIRMLLDVIKSLVLDYETLYSNETLSVDMLSYKEGEIDEGTMMMLVLWHNIALYVVPVIQYMVDEDTWSAVERDVRRSLYHHTASLIYRMAVQLGLGDDETSRATVSGEYHMSPVTFNDYRSFITDGSVLSALSALTRVALTDDQYVSQSAPEFLGLSPEDLARYVTSVDGSGCGADGTATRARLFPLLREYNSSATSPSVVNWFNLLNTRIRLGDLKEFLRDKLVSGTVVQDLIDRRARYTATVATQTRLAHGYRWFQRALLRLVAFITRSAEADGLEDDVGRDEFERRLSIASAILRIDFINNGDSQDAYARAVGRSSNTVYERTYDLTVGPLIV